MSQILKFRLTDGHIFDFEYSKYSEFIDNLEPEPGVIIDVLEPFTLKDFETGLLEYIKYVVYKDALEEIITHSKYWSKEELKELSKYDLKNPVLEWLMIKETREDKDIKEIIFLEDVKNSLNKIFKDKETTNKERIIIYYLCDSINQDKFFTSCQKGHLEVAQWLYSLGDVDIHKHCDICFRWTCHRGYLDLAQWLYSLGDVNIHTQDDMAFKWACQGGHLEVAQWLYLIGQSSGSINIHSCGNEAFREACEYGHLKVVQWLYLIGQSSGGINIHSRNERAFLNACGGGHLELAQWLYSLGGVDIHIMDNCSIQWACAYGHLEVAKWLYSLGGFIKRDIKFFSESVRDWISSPD